MAAVHILDDYYLAITFLITVGYQLFFFAIAFSLKFDKLTDFAGGTNFVLLAILTLACSANRDDARNIVASVFIMAWAARLSGFLLFRIIKTGKDDRFDDKRDKFWSFLGFWVFQMFWVWICSLPVTLLNSPKVTQFAQPGFGTGCDVAGIILFAIGFVMEAVSDVQKYRFRTAHGSDGAVCDVGFFAWTRHPNYFGEIMVQFDETRHLHNRGRTSSKQLRLRWCLRCTICIDPWTLLPDVPSHVPIRSATTGASRRKEEIREGKQLAGLRTIPPSHEHPYPIPTSDLREATSPSQKNNLPGIPNVCL
jgi:steroid 5-alpha reductase family enzyme